MKRPPPLRPGARVALVAPAGPLTDAQIDRAIERVRGWGWEPVLGRHARGRYGYLSAPDEQRLADLNHALRSDDIDAVWCLRGGYGTMRILDRVDWAALARRPRPLIGFSDNTALHLAAQRAGVVSLHGPHPAVDHLPAYAERELLRLLREPGPLGALPFPEQGPRRATTLAGGVAEGPLVGGNLALLCATLGTPHALQPEGAILFLEEVGEKVYRLDRLLSQLRLAGVLDAVAGVVLGAFSESPDQGAPDLPATEEVLVDLLGDLGVPVAADFPFGHVPDSWTLPLGVRARLDADAGTLSLLEPATRPAE